MIRRPLAVLCGALLALVLGATSASADTSVTNAGTYQVAITQQPCPAPLQFQRCVTFTVDGLTTATRFTVTTDQGVRFSGDVIPIGFLLPDPWSGSLVACLVACNVTTTGADNIGANCGNGTCQASFNLSDGQSFPFTVPTFRTPVNVAAGPQGAPAAPPSVNATTTGSTSVPAAPPHLSRLIAPTASPRPVPMEPLTSLAATERLASAPCTVDLVRADLPCQSAPLTVQPNPPLSPLVWPLVMLAVVLGAAWFVFRSRRRDSVRITLRGDAGMGSRRG